MKINKINYQLLTDRILKELPEGKRLLLHACCAPCASYVLEYLTKSFDIDVFYYNPNITSRDEYDRRISEMERLIELLPHERSIRLLPGEYEPEKFFGIASGLENLPEGGARCFRCYRLRLERTARFMSERSGEYDYFATTLTVSPHKNADALNAIGFELEKEYGVRYLPSDFKKRGGYKRSIELSREWGLYRQDYCGCVYSERARHGEKND